MDKGVKVLRMSDDLECPCRLHVVSRFKRTVLATDERGALISILSKGRLAGPLSAVVEELPDEMPLYVLGGPGSNLVVDSATKRFSAKMGKNRPALNAGERATLLRFLQTFSPGESLFYRLEHEGPVRSLMKDFASALPAGPCPDISGFGCGLTPSTDDFLLGALACSDATDSWGAVAIREAVRRALTGMSPVSRSMLSCALEGKYPEVVLRYVEQRNSDNLLAFMRHGSTSGFDMAYGIYALACLREGEEVYGL